MHAVKCLLNRTRVKVIAPDLVHAGQNHLGLTLHIRTRYVGAVAARIGKNGRKPRRLNLGKLPGGLSEIRLGSGLRAETARPPFGDVEIDFENSPLGPERLKEDCEIGFDSFARPAAVRKQKKVLCRLLADGA